MLVRRRRRVVRQHQVAGAFFNIAFVRVHRLFVLAEIVQTTEVFRAMGARERTLAGVFSAVARQVLRAGEQLVAVGVAGAKEHSALQRALCFSVLLQGGRGLFRVS